MIIFGGLGVGLICIRLLGAEPLDLQPVRAPRRRLADTLRQHRQRERGPRIVAIGGGHGLATLLRGLKDYSNNITAIVTVADDGGSSGRLRRDMGILPPGDIRNCLAALSDDEALLTQLFQYRFPRMAKAALEGHSFGNLFITALAEITGSFESRGGRIGPGSGGARAGAAFHAARCASGGRCDACRTLSARCASRAKARSPRAMASVRHVWLEPSNPPAFPQAIQAILAAELIVIGPGSLYTSLLPNLLVPDLADAIRASRALEAVCLQCGHRTRRDQPALPAATISA